MVAKERLAGSLIELSFPAGAEIVREERPGDRFYMLHRRPDRRDGARPTRRPRVVGVFRRDRPAAGRSADGDDHGADGRSALCARARRLPRGGHGLLPAPWKREAVVAERLAPYRRSSLIVTSS